MEVRRQMNPKNATRQAQRASTQIRVAFDLMPPRITEWPREERSIPFTRRNQREQVGGPAPNPPIFSPLSAPTPRLPTARALR